MAKRHNHRWAIVALVVGQGRPRRSFGMAQKPPQTVKVHFNVVVPRVYHRILLGTASTVSARQSPNKRHET